MIDKHGELESNEVLWFIDNFMSCCKTADEYEVMRQTFRAGYCLYFAEILQNAFGRGEVCWTAPFGHFIWQDSKNGKRYDVEGEYCDSEAFYFIPKRYLGSFIKDFRHSDPLEGVYSERNGASVDEIVSIMKEYCRDTGTKFDESVLSYLEPRDDEEGKDTESSGIAQNTTSGAKQMDAFS